MCVCLPYFCRMCFRNMLEHSSQLDGQNEYIRLLCSTLIFFLFFSVKFIFKGSTLSKIKYPEGDETETENRRGVTVQHAMCPAAPVGCNEACCLLFFKFYFYYYNQENMSSSKRHCQFTSISHHKLCTSHVDEWNTLLGGMVNLFTEWKHHFLSQTTTAGTDSNKAQHPAGKKGAFKTQQICHQLNHLTLKKMMNGLVAFEAESLPVKRTWQSADGADEKASRSTLRNHFILRQWGCLSFPNARLLLCENLN